MLIPLTTTAQDLGNLVAAAIAPKTMSQLEATIKGPNLSKFGVLIDNKDGAGEVFFDSFVTVSDTTSSCLLPGEAVSFDVYELKDVTLLASAPQDVRVTITA